MKKLYFCLFALSILLFAGCNGNVPTTTDPTPPTTPVVSTEPTITAPPQDNISNNVPPSYENMYSVALPINVENRYAENGTLLSQYASQSMDFIITDSEVAQKVKYDFYDRIEQNRLDAETMHELAESMFHNGTLTAPLSYSVHYDVTRIDQGVLSLFGELVQTGEGAHTNVQSISANYNLVTGDVLTLGSILYHAECKDDLAELIISKLDAMTADIDLYKEYPQTVRKDFAKDESNYESFYFSTTGLCFFFSPTKIAPRIYQTITVEIPYSELTGIIADEFFPVERTYAEGSVTVSPFTTDAQNKYEQFAQIITAESDHSQEILLTVNHSVQNIRIHQVTRNGIGNEITATKNIFAANMLSANEAIIFEADFSDEIPIYVLSYTSGGQIQYFYFTRNTDTNEITLTTTNDPIKIRSGA